MKLPLHTTSAPIVGSEARLLLNAVKAGRAVSNPCARQFAAEIVAEMRQAGRKAQTARNG